MKFHQDSAAGGLRISGYGPGFVTVAEQRLDATFVITPAELYPDLALPDVAALSWSHLSMLHRAEVELLIVGTGEYQDFPPAALYGELGERRIGLEAMSTPAACRTFNILASEGRRVAAVIVVR